MSTGEFTLASGIKSDYYVDLSKITFSQYSLGLILSYLNDIIDWVSINKVGGPAIGALPIVVGLMITNDKEGFLIRSEEKGHGKKELIEGCLEKGDNVVLVEDITTTGNSLFKAVKAVQEFGANVKQVVSVLDRNQGARELFKKENISFSYLTTIDEVLDSISVD